MLRKHGEQALYKSSRELVTAYQHTAILARDHAGETRERKALEERVARPEEFRPLQEAQAAGEDERKRLAEQLQDNIIASLVAIAVDLGFLKRKAKQMSEELEEALAQLGARIQDTDRQLQNDSMHETVHSRVLASLT